MCKQNNARDEFSDADPLPHRMINPNQYNSSMLSVTEQARINSETLTVRGQVPPVYTYGSVS